MTIHHDKLAYGKVASLNEEFSEERLIAMANMLSEKGESAFPDYKNSIAGLACSVLKSFGIAPPEGENTLPLADRLLSEKDYRTVVVLVLDGMGMSVLETALQGDGLFRAHLAGEYSSVFPPTTAAATTSLLSGVSPCRHGWLGWTGYFPELDKNVVLLTNEDADEGGKVSEQSQAFRTFPYRSVAERIRAAGCDAYIISPFSAPFPADFKQFCSTMRDIVNKKSKKYVYAYWPQPDAVMHDCGASSDEAKHCLAQIEREIEKTFSEFKGDVLFLITADHGHIDAGRNVCIYDFPEIAACLKRPPSCEPRALNLFVKEGFAEKFKNAFSERFGSCFRLYTRDEILSSGLFGEGAPRSGLEKVIGDFFAVATGDTSIFNTREKAKKFVGVHAGLTRDELRIPLIALKK